MSKNEPAPFSFIENGGGSGLCKNDREPLPFLQILEHDAWMNMKKTILNWKVVVDSLLWCDFMSELHILIMVALMLPMFYFPAAAQNQKTYDIEVSGISPVLFLDIWDYDAEDHDRVKVTLNGTIISAFEITHTPKKVTIPLVFVDGEAIVEIIGTYSGRGPVTYAVRATGIGTGVGVYKHSAGVGSGNSYRIVKQEDSLTKLWNNIWGNNESICLEEEYEEVCKQGCTDNCEAAKNKLIRRLRFENMINGMKRDCSGFLRGGVIAVDYIAGFAFKGKTKGGLFDMRYGYNKAGRKGTGIIKNTELAIDLLEKNEPEIIIGFMGVAGVRYANELSAGYSLGGAVADARIEMEEYKKKWTAYCQQQWDIFNKQHQKIKRKKY